MDRVCSTCGYCDRRKLTLRHATIYYYWCWHNSPHQVCGGDNDCGHWRPKGRYPAGLARGEHYSVIGMRRSDD